MSTRHRSRPRSEIAREEGVDDRVTFSVAGADAYPARGYDLICFFDCLHDMGRPVDAARHAADAVAADGTVMLVEPSAGDKVEDNINPVGRLYYAASTTMCCAHAISENGTHVLGAQAGPKELESVLRSAGFGSVRTATQNAVQSDPRSAAMSNCRRAVGIFRRPPGERLRLTVVGTGSNSRDDDRMVPRQLVPTDAWRNLMMAGVSGFWSSPVSTSRMRLPALNRRAFATSGMR